MAAAATLRLASSERSATLPRLTAEQNAALITLFDVDDSEIIACLGLIRSIELNFQPRAGGGRYSPTEISALKCLSVEANEDIKLWLALHRLQRKSGKSRIEVLPESSEVPASHSPAKASYADVVKGGSPRNAPIALKSKAEAPATSKQQSAFTSKKKRRYWSTSQDYKRVMTTYNGFRRHEREREIFYVFFPNDVYDSSFSEPTCVLCLARNPDDDHWEKEHGVSKHVGSATTPIKKSRKGDFEELLAKMKVPKHRIERLVERWRRTSNKEGYSCGLCISRFDELLQRTNHLATEHYEKGQDRKMWKFDNLIKGLLLEPQINREYRRQFGLNPSDQHSGLTWDPADVPGLQERLEMCVEEPAILARAARDLATMHKPTSEDYNLQTTASQPMTASFDHLSFMTPSIRDDSNTTWTTDHAAKSQGFSTDMTQDDPNLGVQADRPQAISGYPVVTTLDTINGPSFNRDTAGYDGSVYATGSAFSEMPSYDDIPSPDIVSGVGAGKERGTYAPNSSGASRVVAAPVPTPYGASSSSQGEQPWHMQKQLEGPPHFIRNTPLYLRQPKRQLSQSSMDAAHVKPQKISPMPSQLRQMTHR